MNNQELIEYCESLKGDLNKFINGIDVNKIIAKIEQLDEPQKVKIPNFVAEWIEYCKAHDFTLFGCIDPANDFEDLADETFKGDIRKCIRWCRRESDIFARAWLDGYTVGKEKRYLVKIIGITNYNSYLNYHKEENKWTIESRMETDAIRTKHTRKELEEAGFGEVFNSPLFEVEEVTE